MSKAKTENLEMCRAVRREMGRHSLDCSEVQVTAVHGQIHLHGRVRPLRGHEGGFETAINGLLKALRSRSGIREVYPEWTAVL